MERKINGLMTLFQTGAKRSSDAVSTRYDLISPVGLRRLAETYAEGAAKYGDNNWHKGFPVSDVMNHCLKHINQWLSGDTTEDHLAHAAWNLFAVMHYEELLPEAIDVVTRPQCKQKSPRPQKSPRSNRRRTTRRKAISNR